MIQTAETETHQEGKLPDVLTVRQTASYLHLSEQSVRTLCTTGEIPALFIARRWRIPKAGILSMFKGVFAYA